jgi:hypothetical protein
MKNIKFSSKEDCKIHNYEFKSNRYHFVPSDLILLYSYAVKHSCIGLSVGILFCWDCVMVAEEYEEEFECICKYLEINWYTEEQWTKFNKVMNERKEK